MIRNIDHPGDYAPIPPDGPTKVRSQTKRVYDRGFWFCYVSNAMLMIAVSLLFRYADFVSLLGGNERHLGTVVGVGTIGALAVRVLLGMGIDRFGPRQIWLGSLVVFVVAALGHLAIQTVHGPAVYFVRILLTIGVAGGVGASLTYVSLRVPESRIAEMVGTIGTSGFLGLAIGPVIGDLLFRSAVTTRHHVDRMFLLAALAGIIALVAAAIATRGQVRQKARRRYPPFLPLVRRYQPGVILLVALAMGLGIGLPGVFVRSYAAELNITGIQSYFLVYAVVAFAVRVATRRLTQRIGIRAVVLVGVGALSASMLLYLVVEQPWQFAIPAIAAGFSHALLFPAVVAGGSIAFPIRYRGLATTLVLGMFDVGNLIGQPAVGNTLHYADQFGLPKYTTMFVLVALFMVVVACVYAWFTRQTLPTQDRHSNRRTKSTPRAPRGRSPATKDSATSSAAKPGARSRFIPR